MRARFTCLPAWAWLTTIILTECILLAAWLCREYFVFDYTCFMLQLNNDLDGGPPQKIHLVMELPEEPFNQTRLLQERSANTTMSTINYNLTVPLTKKTKSKIRKKKRPQKGRTMNPRRTIESVVRIEPLLSLYSDNGEQVPFKTKTTWNKFHKQMPPRLHTNGTRTTKRRRKKRPGDAMSRRQAALGKQNKQNKVPTNLQTTTQPVIEFTLNSTEWNFDEPIATTTEAHLIERKCKTCQEKYEDDLRSTSFGDQKSRWRTHGVGGPTTLVNSPEGLNFTEQVQKFFENAICIGRTMANFWSIAQILASIPFLMGIQFKVRCLFTPSLVLSALFLIVLFLYAATLTIFSLVLFVLVDEMILETLLDWMLFAVVLDAVFVLATLTFALTLQNCDALLTEYQQEQIVELPDTIVVDPDFIEQEDGSKRQRSKSILYAQLAVDDFMNGGP
ncbi:hypothetical protein M3Y97_00428700 [Aphelenchoides bicaudatus]|nr:hypothetical protein M3Y97_00428700 [Aphelenchoides bicaudatus]